LNPQATNAENGMPRASWKGFLRLSLVSCPVYLSPATTRAKPVRLHQVWVPSTESSREGQAELDEPEDQPEPRVGRRSGRPEPAETPDDEAEPEPLHEGPATRIALRPHDPHTGEEIDHDQLRKGYEYERGRFVTFTPAELKSLDVESSHTIELTSFVPRAEIDPIYFDTAYYLYPDGAVGLEPYRVIGAALAETDMAGLGRLTLSRRERMVLVEPRGPGMALITLRAAEEVRAADFTRYEREVDAEAVEIAAMIINRKAGAFDVSTFRDRYQDALRAMIEAKIAGLPVKQSRAIAPAPAHDLITALKRSLEQESGAAAAKPKRKGAGDRRQKSLLLPMAGKRETQPAPVRAEPAAKRRRKA
jgi:DNA end-binding protein Ku